MQQSFIMHSNRSPPAFPFLVFNFKQLLKNAGVRMKRRSQSFNFRFRHLVDRMHVAQVPSRLDHHQIFVRIESFRRPLCSLQISRMSQDGNPDCRETFLSGIQHCIHSKQTVPGSEAGFPSRPAAQTSRGLLRTREVSITILELYGVPCTMPTQGLAIAMGFSSIPKKVLH